MKKNLLSILALALMMVMVACNNSAKFADAKIKLANDYTAKLDSVNTLEAIQALQAGYATAEAEVLKGAEEVKFTEEETAAIDAATTALITKSQEVIDRIQKELQAAAALADTTTVAVVEEIKK